MRRAYVVAFALVASLLVVTAVPAKVEAADAGLEAASQHTTDSDFTNATTLDNVTVQGSGASADVALDSQAGVAFDDSFEDEPADSGTPDAWTNTATGTWNVTTNRAFDGSQSASISVSADTGQAEHTLSEGTTANVTFDIWAENVNKPNSQGGLKLIENGTMVVQVASRDDGLQYYGGSGWVQITNEVNDNEWATVTIYNIDPSADTFAVKWSTAGGQTGTATGLTMASGMQSQYDTLAMATYDDTAFWDDIEVASTSSKDRGTYISQTHNAERVEEGWTNLTLQNASAEVSWLADTDGDGTFETTAASATYTTSGNKTVDLSGTDASAWRVNVTFINETGTTTAKLHDEGVLFNASTPQASNLSPDGVTKRDDDVQLSVDVNDSDFGTAQGDNVTVTFTVNGSDVATKTVSSNGTVTTTVNNLAEGSHDWNVTLTDDYGETTTSQTATFTVDHFDPQLDNSSASPTGPQSDDPQQFSIDVTDRDFASEDDGDSVTVEFYVDGSKVGEDTLTSNGTATLSRAFDGGNHTWHAEATDSYGSGVDTTSDTFEYSIPATIDIRNETNASQLINNTVSVHVTLYSGDRKTVLERDVSDGTLNLSGLPVSEPVVLAFNASGYYSRTMFFESIFEQDDAYLLNKSKAPNAKTVEFEVDDRTGVFGTEDTSLRIERAVDKDNDGNLTWDRVAGDFLDAGGGFVFTGQDDQRYRIIVANGQGQKRNLGPYTIIETRTETLVIGKIEWPAKQGNATVFRANSTQESQLGNTPPVIAILYQDGANQTTDLSVTVYEQGNRSNNTIFTDNPSGTFGRYYAEVNVTDAQLNNHTYVVELNYTHDGESVSQTRLVGTRQLGLPIDPAWLSGAILVFAPMMITLYGPRTWQYGLVLTMAVVGIGMLLALVQIPIAAYGIAGIITAAGVLRTEAQSAPT